MGFLFKKPKFKEEDEDDPEWQELKRFREEQKKKVSGQAAAEKTGITGKPAAGHTEGEEERNELKPLEEKSVSTPPPPEIQFRCSRCGAVYPESWNRCPKCGGEVVPLEKKKPPITGHSPDFPISGHSDAGAGMVSGVTPPGPVKKVKKVKKMKRKSTPPDRRKNTSVADKGPVPVPPGKSPAIPRAPLSTSVEKDEDIHRIKFSDPALDGLFEPDPLLDGFEDDENISTDSPWKEASRSALDTPPVHPHTHPRVKEMLSELIGAGPPGKLERKTLVCTRCGFVQPPGDWDFCMKCGARLRK